MFGSKKVVSVVNRLHSYTGKQIDRVEDKVSNLKEILEARFGSDSLTTLRKRIDRFDHSFSELQKKLSDQISGSDFKKLGEDVTKALNHGFEDLKHVRQELKDVRQNLHSLNSSFTNLVKTSFATKKDFEELKKALFEAIEKQDDNRSSGGGKKSSNKHVHGGK